ncbi:hypothetical protein, conserved [Plasmodium gonderi]|uniref:U3 small nucleolar RNA-associated protein 20 domain-containing protein n=1 Tax=Plasmodium gonderi TaxID=77519 RepID=A0A1Y1JS45_PLAGO|nr:hypothetical protein, conserved [Plasmodium gonderi]GAW82814.1 hypothetical protein, conserved [Plasmodium gonderi]
MKKSMKNIKLKLRNKKKKGNFVSFYDRIKEINEKEKLNLCSILSGENYDDNFVSHKISPESKDSEYLKRTNFYSALQEYPQNCHNSDFRKCCRELQPYAKNLMLILLNKDRIFGIILKYIHSSKIQNDEAYFYKLLVILIKDLKDESKKYVEHILKILYDKINFNNLDLLEEIFNTYANIFRIMNRRIINNVDKYIKISLPLLHHRNNIVKIFIADSFSYLLRKLSLHNLIVCFQKLFSFFNYVKMNKLGYYCETISLLMLEALKVDKNKLSKKTLPFLKFIIYSVFLKETYYCKESENYYDPIEYTNRIKFLEKAIASFFRDLYNFTKNGTFEFVEIFLTFILKNYSLLYIKYYTDLLVVSDQITNILHLLTGQKDPKVLNSNFPVSAIPEGNNNTNQEIGIENNCQFWNDNGAETSPNFYIKNDKHDGSIILGKCNNIVNDDESPFCDANKKIFFMKEIFHKSTNFFLKKILNIWIEKNNEKKNIIMETTLGELSKYAQRMNNLKLNYITYFYIWNIYDNMFFLLNHDVVSNEGLKNMYISLVNTFMNIMTEQQEEQDRYNKTIHNNFCNSLFCCFILKLDEVISRKNQGGYDIHMNNFLRHIFVSITKDVQNTDIFLLEQMCHMFDERQGLDTSKELTTNENTWNEIGSNKFSHNFNDKWSQNFTNLCLGKMLVLYDILKIVTKRGRNSLIQISHKRTSCTEVESEDNYKKKRKSTNACIDEPTKNYSSSCEPIYIINENNTACNSSSQCDSATQIKTELQNLFFFIFEKVKMILIIIKGINNYLNIENSLSVTNLEEDVSSNEQEKYLQLVIQFLFAYVSLLTEISTVNNSILLRCIQCSSYKNEEDNYFDTFRNICDNVEKLKCSNFVQKKFNKENLFNMKFYMNSIILDANIIMTTLSKCIQNDRTIVENVLSSNNTFLYNCLSKWNRHDMYCGNYFNKIKNILMNLHEMKYFESKMDDIYSYLKVLKKLFFFCDIGNRKEFLQIIKFLIGIFIELKNMNKSYTTKEHVNVSERINFTCYDKLLPLFDCMIYLENQKYIATHEKIYESKIVDIVNYLTFFKNFNILKEYVLKVSIKICIVELFMLLNVNLVSIHKSVIVHMKSFMRSYSIEKKVDDEKSYYYQLDYYFYILNGIFKMSKKKLYDLEGTLGRKKAQAGESVSYSHEEVSSFAEGKEADEEEVSQEEVNEENEDEKKVDEENVDEKKVDEAKKQKEQNAMDTFTHHVDLRNFILHSIDECEKEMRQYLYVKKTMDTSPWSGVENVNTENAFKIVLMSLDMLIVPQANSINRSYKIRILDMYIWIMEYINNSLIYYVHELKYYSMMNVLFDITSNLNDLFQGYRDDTTNSISSAFIMNSAKSQINEIKLCIKTFVTKFMHNMNILKIPNILKFVHILCSCNKKLNNYKNDIEEILLEKNVNITKLLLNIKEEDSNIITPILIKIIFCILRNKMKKGNYKLKKNIIFYLSSISCENYCHILISVIYPFVNVYKSKIDYNNLLRHGDKEKVLVNFLRTCQGKFSNHWNYEFDVINMNLKNSNIKSMNKLTFPYDDIFNYSSWHFNDYIIEIKKDALFKNFHFSKNLNLFIEMLKIMKYKLNNYFEFFFHVFVTISYYINGYYYIKKKVKSRSIYLTVKKMNFRKYKFSTCSASHDLCSNEEKIQNVEAHHIIRTSGKNREGENESYIDGEDYYQYHHIHPSKDEECTNTVEENIELKIKNSYLKNVNKKCIEHIQFIMQNYEIMEDNLMKAKDFFTFLFYKNVKIMGKQNGFLNILFNIWSKNESYHDFYNSIIPNSILVLIKSINNKTVIDRLNYNEWNNITEKIFSIILRLCGYNDIALNDFELHKDGSAIKKEQNKKSRKHRVSQNQLIMKKCSDMCMSKSMKILEPFILDIIICIKRTILRRYTILLAQKKNGITFGRRSKIDELKILNNKELHILIELSSMNKNQLYNMHVMNIIMTFVLINAKSLHSTNPEHIQKIKLILIALKRLIINISKGENELTNWRQKNKKWNLSCYKEKDHALHSHAHLPQMNNEKKDKKRIKKGICLSKSHSIKHLHKMYICYKLKTMVYEIVQRCYDITCRNIAGELLIMVGCIFLKIRNINKYLQKFKKNMELFLRENNDLNYNSKGVLKHIMKIPLRNDEIKKSNYYYTFLQITQIFCAMNISIERISQHEYDADAQFLILLDLSNVKMSKVINNYAQKRGVKKDNYKTTSVCNQPGSFPSGNEHTNQVIKNKNGEIKMKKMKRQELTFSHLFLNSHIIFYEVIVRHCAFLIFNEKTNEMVRDKSIQFILFFIKLLKCLLQAYEKDETNDRNVRNDKNDKNDRNEKYSDNSNLVRDIRICTHFVVNIIIPKALNALKKNANDFTRISLQIILTASKHVCPHMKILRKLNIGSFLRDVKNSLIRNYVLNENDNSLLCFNAVKTKHHEESYNRENGNNYGEDETSSKILEKLLFHDLYYNVIENFHKNNSQDKGIKKREKYKECSIIQNIIDIKSENNSKSVEKLVMITPYLCFYTISKIIIPLSLNYILQTNSKKETYNKILSSNSIKLLGACTERVGIKIVYNLLELLLSELKKNSFNKLYIEKAISHIVRTYDFREFQDYHVEHNCDPRSEGKRRKRGEIAHPIRKFSKELQNYGKDDSVVYVTEKNQFESNTMEAKLEEAKLEEAKLEEAKLEEAKLEEAKLEEAKLEVAKQVEAKCMGETNTQNPFCHKFIKRILPQLKFLMFDKSAMNNKKKQKSYINDLVVDYKNKEAIAKSDLIISFLVILNKMNYNFEKELHRIIYKLCFCLSSKINNVRSESKKTLCYISMYLGLNYFDLIIKQMSDYLTKGYHVPIFLCTVNSILESVLNEKEKFLDKNYLKIGFNTLNEGNLRKSKKIYPGFYNRSSGTSHIGGRNNNREGKSHSSNPLDYSSALHDTLCSNIFNMVKLEIINEIDKNTEDVNKKHIKRKTKESKKTYGKNIIKLLTNIVPEKCIEDNVLTFLESLFSGESFENYEVDKNFIFKKKYFFIISSYFNYFVKGIEENKSLSPKFILNITYKLFTKSIYFFRGDNYKNLLAVMQNCKILFFKYNMSNEAIHSFASFKKSIQFYVSLKTTEEKCLGFNYQNKCIQYPIKGNNNMNIIQGSFQEKNIYDAIGETKKFDFQVHAQVLAKVSLKLLFHMIKRASSLFNEGGNLTTCLRTSNGTSNRILRISEERDSMDNVNGDFRNDCDIDRMKINNNLNGVINEVPNYPSIYTTINDISTKENTNIQKEQKSANHNDKLNIVEHIKPIHEKINSKIVSCDYYPFTNFPEFIRLIEPLLVYCFCYGKEDVFVLSSKCIKIIKKKKLCDFRKFGKLIILSSVDILKNIPNYYSKEFDKLILSCIDALTYLIRGNNKNDIISWLNSDLSNRANPNENVDNCPNQSPISKNKKRIEDTSKGKSCHSQKDNAHSLKRQKKLNYLLDENVLSTYYNNNEENEDGCDSYEESTNSLRYCLINQISLLLESKNHVWELLILFKNCMLREDINNIIKKGYIILKMNSCVDQIFTIMIEESHNLKLSFLCGQIYIDFLMRFPISKTEKKKKFFQILNNLNDENDDSRIAILNALYVFLNRANAKLLKEEFYYITFASILAHFSNETNYKCKKMYIFLTTLLFQQVNDLIYVFNSYKILKHNLLFCKKASFTYTYLYILPIFASIFFERIPLYGKMILSDDKLAQDELRLVSKEYQKSRREKIMFLKLQERDTSRENYETFEKGQNSQGELNERNVYNINETNSSNQVDTIRNYFISELLKSTKGNMNKYNQNGNNELLTSPHDINIIFMKNQLEDLFLSFIYHLIDTRCSDIKEFMKEDKLSFHIITSVQNITYFCGKYDICGYMGKDLVHLFYKSLEQIFSYMDIDIIENLVHEKYAHEMYKLYFLKKGHLKYVNGSDTNVENKQDHYTVINGETIHEKLILYFLYFWNLIIQNGLFNKNPYVQIISLKISLNYIDKKMAYPFFPLLLVKLFSTNKFVINLILKKVLSLLLNSYFLEHFYIYHKDISFLLAKICILLVKFPWITNGLDDKNDVKEASYENYYSASDEKTNYPIISHNNKDTDHLPMSFIPNSTTPGDPSKHNERNDHSSDSSNEEYDEEFKKVNSILENGHNLEMTKNTYNHSFIQPHNHTSRIMTENSKITKELLSYSKFFLVIVTLSRAINIHLINKKKSFARILTILQTYKNIIQDFPEDLWSPENEIINIVLSSLYKIASMFKRKLFVQDENIFEETNSYNKFVYLSSYAWDIISLLEEKLQNKRGTFNKAFVQARQRINRIRFIKKRRKNILALKNPKLFTLNKLKRREKKRMEKKKNKMDF